MGKSTHIIHRLVLNIEVPGRGMEKNAEKTVVNYFEQVLIKRIEEILDSIDTEGHLLIDKLEVDLGKLVLKGDELSGQEENFVEAFQSLVIDFPGRAADTNEAEFTRLSPSDKALRIFIYFLQNGRLPWYALSALQDEEEWLEQIYRALEKDVVAKNELLRLINEPVALSRLFAQFSPAAVKKLTALLLGLNVGDMDGVIEQQLKTSITNNTTGAFSFFVRIILLIYLRSADRQIFESAYLQEQFPYITYQPVNSIIDDLQMVDKLLSAAQKINKDNIADSKEPQTQDTEPDGVFVTQAGLVILHPFLEYFFKDFGLIQNDDFVDIHARQLGVHLLHYLATGQVNAFEYDLYFEKFFCYWPDDAIIERRVDIPQLMRDEADNLLKAVIKHWKALKNTSPGGLREGFLTRNGKLIESENPVRLIIEKKDMDVLLATLPWGISVVKLPWMREPFYVEWQ